MKECVRKISGANNKATSRRQITLYNTAKTGKIHKSKEIRWDKKKKVESGEMEEKYTKAETFARTVIH